MSDTPRVYRNEDGEPCTIDWLCRHSPMWAANQIRDRDKLERELAEARNALCDLGLSRQHHPTLKDAAKGITAIVESLRRDCGDPPHDVQMAVLEKLGLRDVIADRDRLAAESIPIEWLTRHAYRLLRDPHSTEGQVVLAAIRDWRAEQATTEEDG